MRADQVPEGRPIPSRFRNSSPVKPKTRMTLFRPLWPAAILTDDRGTFKRLAKNSTHASLAFPSTGGAVSDTLSASPTSPVIAFFFARGCTFTRNVAPPLLSCMAIKTSPEENLRVPHFSRFSRSGTYSLVPKIAVPTRTQVDPSSIATSKSCDMPIDRTSMLIPGSLRLSISSRRARNRLK